MFPNTGCCCVHRYETPGGVDPNIGVRVANVTFRNVSGTVVPSHHRLVGDPSTLVDAAGSFFGKEGRGCELFMDGINIRHGAAYVLLCMRRGRVYPCWSTCLPDSVKRHGIHGWMMSLSPDSTHTLTGAMPPHRQSGLVTTQMLLPTRRRPYPHRFQRPVFDSEERGVDVGSRFVKLVVFSSAGRRQDDLLNHRYVLLFTKLCVEEDQWMAGEPYCHRNTASPLCNRSANDEALAWYAETSFARFTPTQNTF